MKPLGLALLVVSALCAQNRSGFVNPGNITRIPGSVVFPGGTSAMPGIQRTFGSALNPGGGVAIGIPGLVGVSPAASRVGFRHNGSIFGGYLVPTYIGDYSGSYMGYDPSAVPPQVQQPQQPQQAPNITIIYPPASAPIVVNPGAAIQSQGSAAYQPPMQPPQFQPMGPPAPPQAEPVHYLIAFKDHTIYSAVAYWVQGDTLHYFTDGNTHNQASVSLVDRDLTRQLNQDSGMEVKLPPAK